MGRLWLIIKRMVKKSWITNNYKKTPKITLGVFYKIM